MSRKSRPKQFLDLGLGTTLFRSTLDRITSAGRHCGLENVDRSLNTAGKEEQGPLFDPRPIIVSNSEYKYLIAEELLLADCRADVLLEPEARNSCAAIAAACLKAVERDPEAIILVVPSDHDIPDQAEFERCVTDGLEAAGAGRIVLFGVNADTSETGFGYITCNVSGRPPYKVTAFIEKPDVEHARRLVANGSWWNTGMFLMRADTAIHAISKHVPDLLEHVTLSYRAGWEQKILSGNGKVGQPNHPSGTRASRFWALEGEAFSAIAPVSFDHAVMEHTALGSLLPATFRWRDVGNWESVSDGFVADESNNRMDGNVCVRTSANNVVKSTNRLTALFGVENLIVVDSPGALLIADRTKAAEVGELAEELSVSGHRRTNEGVIHSKPWGSFTCIEEGKGFQVKRLSVFPGASLSLQAHKHRSEHWVVIKGEAEVEIDEKKSRLNANDFIQIPAGSRHRLTNTGEGPLLVIEVQTGDYLGEDDIIRYEDLYNRV